MRHCDPSCRYCEAAERLGRVALILEDIGDTEAADAAYALADRASQRNPVGARLVAALLIDTRTEEA